MIIVLGGIVARSDSIDEALQVSLEHVHRSRLEPGCLLHSVHRDVEDPLHLVFVENWVDRAALDAHFVVPESRSFVKALRGLAASATAMEIYEAERVTF